MCKQLCVVHGRRAGEANLTYSHILTLMHVHKCVLRKISHYISFLPSQTNKTKEDFWLEKGSTYNLEIAPKLKKEMGLKTK